MLKYFDTGTLYGKITHLWSLTKFRFDFNVFTSNALHLIRDFILKFTKRLTVRFQKDPQNLKNPNLHEIYFNPHHSFNNKYIYPSPPPPPIFFWSSPDIGLSYEDFKIICDVSLCLWMLHTLQTPNSFVLMICYLLPRMGERLSLIYRIEGSRTIPHEIQIKPNHCPSGPQSLGLFPTRTTPH